MGHTKFTLSIKNHVRIIKIVFHFNQLVSVLICTRAGTQLDPTHLPGLPLRFSFNYIHSF